MAYDGELTARFEGFLDGLPGVTQKRMMGGCCFFINGNMIGGASRDKQGRPRFMFRVGKDNMAHAEKLEGGEPMIHGGRLMSGFYHLGADETEETTIRDWVSLAVSHAMALPAK